MKTHVVVIGVVQFNKKILILKRTSDRRSSPNKWQPVSGFMNEKEAAEDAVLREVKEETGLTGKIIKAGKIFEVTDDWGRWIIVCFLISVKSNKVTIDLNEHTDFKWINPKDYTKFDCVKGVKEDFESISLL